MKNILVIFGFLMSITRICCGQSNDTQNVQVACPDPAVVSLDIHWISIYPPQDYTLYNILGEIRNLGTGHYNPGPSMMKAYLYADRGLGYKLVKAEFLPPLAPGQNHFIAFQGKLKPGQSVPKYLLKIAPTINAPAILTDCDVSNNSKRFQYSGSHLIGATSFTGGK